MDKFNQGKKVAVKYSEWNFTCHIAIQLVSLAKNLAYPIIILAHFIQES